MIAIGESYERGAEIGRLRTLANAIERIDHINERVRHSPRTLRTTGKGSTCQHSPIRVCLIPVKRILKRQDRDEIFAKFLVVQVALLTFLFYIVGRAPRDEIGAGILQLKATRLVRQFDQMVSLEKSIEIEIDHFSFFESHE